MYTFCLQILHGNSDTFNVATNSLNPPLIASAIRILPYSNHSRTVCLRLGLVGCPFEGGQKRLCIFLIFLCIFRKSYVIQHAPGHGAWCHFGAAGHHLRRVGGLSDRAPHRGARPARGRQLWGRELQSCGRERNCQRLAPKNLNTLYFKRKYLIVIKNITSYLKFSNGKCLN